MRYLSTRGEAAEAGFEAVLLDGLARDGGLTLPTLWPRFSFDEQRAMVGLPYAELVTRVIAPFVGEAISEEALGAMAAESYAGFDHAAVAPLKQLGPGLWLMELFHGPTLAFKDYPLQMVGRLFDHVLRARGGHVTIVGATSGDTGSAAIESCRGRGSIDIFILHPHGRVSEVQRRQMTSVGEPNVHNLAIQGTFDDCQDLVKALFNDHAFRDEARLSAVNSINWARIMVQVAYYFHAALALGAPERSVAFSVPTGNFGNVFAGYVARQMGLPIARLIVGSNRNDILTRFFESGAMTMAPVEPSLSPSMDIQVSSNFERLLFDLLERDGAAVARTLAGFRQSGAFRLGEPVMARARALFEAHRCDDEASLAEVARTRAETGELVDPHSAIGIAAARAARTAPEVPLVAMATAHPAKFPEAVERAVGERPALPERLADLYERDEHFSVLPNDLWAVRSYIRERLRVAGAA